MSAMFKPKSNIRNPKSKDPSVFRCRICDVGCRRCKNRHIESEIYPNTLIDSQDEELVGSNKYKMYFDKGDFFPILDTKGHLWDKNILLKTL